MIKMNKTKNISERIISGKVLVEKKGIQFCLLLIAEKTA
jgi:hypothetical protein